MSALTVLAASEGMTAEGMTTAITNIMNVVGTVVNTISQNPVLMTFFSAGLVGVAIGLVSRLKRI